MGMQTVQRIEQSICHSLAIGEPSFTAHIVRGLIVQMTNPEAALAMSAIVTLVIRGRVLYRTNIMLVDGR